MKAFGKILCAVLCLALLLSTLTACRDKKQQQKTSEVMPTPIIIYVTPEPAATPVAQPASGEPAVQTQPASGEPAAVTPLPTAVPTPTPAPTATPAPTPASPPSVTKSPTDERLTEGGTCLFVARADNASSIVWHLVSPDGSTDITYDAARSYFPTLSISGGTETTLRLSNVPLSMNGWRAYCRFTNSVGSTSSGSAVVSVTAAATPVPTPTSAPAPQYDQTDYSGTYYDSNAGRAIMTVTGSPGRYTVRVTWSSSAFEHAEWTFSGSFDSNGKLYYSDGTKTTVSYDQDGIETITTDYTNGGGCLYTNAGNGLRWEDYQEGIANDVLFQ